MRTSAYFVECTTSSDDSTDPEYEWLQKYALELQREMPTPDLILYMSCNSGTLQNRVKEHPEIIKNSLDRQLALYQVWIGSRQENTLSLDNSGCTLEAVRRLFQENPTC